MAQIPNIEVKIGLVTETPQANPINRSLSERLNEIRQEWEVEAARRDANHRKVTELARRLGVTPKPTSPNFPGSDRERGIVQGIDGERYELVDILDALERRMPPTDDRTALAAAAGATAASVAGAVMPRRSILSLLTLGWIRPEPE